MTRTAATVNGARNHFRPSPNTEIERLGIRPSHVWGVYVRLHIEWMKYLRSRAQD